MTLCDRGSAECDSRQTTPSHQLSLPLNAPPTPKLYPAVTTTGSKGGGRGGFIQWNGYGKLVMKYIDKSLFTPQRRVH